MKYPKLKNIDLDIAKKIADNYQLSLPIAKVLTARNFSEGKILENFLNPTLKEGILHPSDLKNLTSACILISEFITNKKTIAICCDFDVDGLSSAGLVANFIRELNGNFKIFVPDRFKDGYGLNVRMIEQIASENIELIITLDYGTTNFKEINLAKELGIKTIVVDHHRVGDEIVPADYFINPCQKDCGFADAMLSAAGLAWYLCAGIKSVHNNSQEIDLRKYLDFACLGTICDMVPLIGVNRVIASKGLYYLKNSENKGIKALLAVSSLNSTKLSSTDVSFILGPRINAAGRMDSPEIVVELFITEDENRALELARRLNSLNQDRQKIEYEARNKVVEKVENLESLPPGLVIYDDNLHQGVLGILAQRLVEKFNVPSIVLTRDQQNFKGSVRSVKGFDVFKSLESCSDLLIKFGGHSAAGGLTIDENNLEKFINLWTQKVKVSEIENLLEVVADSDLTISELNDKLVSDLNKLSPFGMENSSPYFYFSNLIIEDIKLVKDQHLKLILNDGKYKVKGIFWKQTSHPDVFFGNKIDLNARVEINYFNGNKEFQLIIGAIKTYNK